MAPANRHPFLDCRGPIGFAHRGGAGEAPENTLPAFEAAIALGCRHLETDAQITRDGILVALHDGRLERTTDGTGAVAERDFADIQAVDAGYRFSPDGGRSHPYRGLGLRIPRLEELMVRWPRARFNIDIKSGRCTEAFLDLLGRLDAWDRVCVGSVSRVRQRDILRRGRPCLAMAQGTLALARLTSPLGWMPRLGADCIQVSLGDGPTPILTDRLIEAAHRAGLPVHAWTVNDEAVMHELLDLGVDGIMTDYPRLLGEVFAGRGLDIGGVASPR